MVNWNPYIKGFKAYLQLEKSLSKNSIEAYQRDMEKLIQFFNAKDMAPQPADVNLATLREFLRWITELGMSTTSQARILSGIKAFYNYLLMEDLITKNPA